MSRHKPPTKHELAEWKIQGSYAGCDAVRRMIVEIQNARDYNAKLNKQLGAFIAASSLPKPTQGREGRLLRLQTENTDLKNVNDGLVETVVDLRSALREYGQHVVLCPQSLPPDERPCDCGFGDKLIG